MIKIIVGMNLPPRWVPVLKAEGWGAVHWSAIGAPGAADADILRYAKGGGYAVLTHDLDFGAILAATDGHAPSVIQVRAQDVFPEGIGRDSAEVFAMLKSGLEKAVTPLDDFDLILAACALANDLVMVTNNVKHFERIEGLRLTNLAQESP